MAPTSSVGVDEGHFTLIITVSSYMKPRRVYWVRCSAFDIECTPFRDIVTGKSVWSDSHILRWNSSEQVTPENLRECTSRVAWSQNKYCEIIDTKLASFPPFWILIFLNGYRWQGNQILHTHQRLVVHVIPSPPRYTTKVYNDFCHRCEHLWSSYNTWLFPN